MIHAAGTHELAYRFQEIRHAAVSRQRLVGLLTGRLLELEDRHHHECYRPAMRHMIHPAYAMRESMDIPGELHVNRMSAIEGCTRHRQTGFDILRLLHSDR